MLAEAHLTAVVYDPPPSRPPILAPIHAHGLCFRRLRRDQRRRRDGNRCRRQPTKQPSTRNRFRHENLLQQVPQQGGLADLARASLAYWDSRPGELGRGRLTAPRGGTPTI